VVKIEERLEKAGFKMASKRITELRERKRKLALAYEHFRFVREEKIRAFNEKLRKKTQDGYKFQTLTFTPIGDYQETPPDHVLDALESAMEKKCFDDFEIAHIVTVEKLPDPILFGRIKSCPDRFYIAQWDNDVKIEDILANNEG
jgi:hypothetical protein